VLWDGFTVTQGGNWATHPTYCTDVVIKNLHITGRRDGIDIDSCKNVRIENCNVDTGDDAISLKSGRGMDSARLAKPTEDVVITNCTLRDRTFACIGIGSETSGGVRNVRIENCHFLLSGSSAIYIKTRIGRGGAIENISGDDLDVQAGGFLQVNLISSGNENTADDSVEGLVGYPLGRNFSFSNVRVACTTLVDVTKISPEKPLAGLTLSNITGTCTKGISLANITDANLHDIKVTGMPGALVTVKNVTGSGLDDASAAGPAAPGKS
jgi:polygalacturonase